MAKNFRVDMSSTVLSGKEHCLAAYIEALPAVVWRIDIVGNEITFLNNYMIPSLGEYARAVLQNPVQAEERIPKEDRQRFHHCYNQVRNRHATACTFRMRLENGSMGWFKIIAMPDPENPSCSVGLLLDITAHVNTILSTEGRPGLSEKIDLVPDPVLLVRFSDRRVFRANQAALQLLGYSSQQITSLDLDMLLQNNPKNRLFEIYEGLIFSDAWCGEIKVSDAMGRHHQCSAHIEGIARDDENVLWVTLSHLNSCQACKGIPVRGNESVSVREVRAAMKKCRTVKQLLEAMLAALPPESPTDAIMLSRIFIAQNQVLVTGAGEPFESVPENRSHLYEGSIAENIVRFNLSNHVVMETSKSIKAIDWALFIPRGIHSYYAQPFFDDGVLTKVLIFCSRGAGNYDPDAPAPMQELYPDFLDHLERCLS